MAKESLLTPSQRASAKAAREEEQLQIERQLEREGKRQHALSVLTSFFFYAADVIKARNKRRGEAAGKIQRRLLLFMLILGMRRGVKKIKSRAKIGFLFIRAYIVPSRRRVRAARKIQRAALLFLRKKVLHRVLTATKKGVLLQNSILLEKEFGKLYARCNQLERLVLSLSPNTVLATIEQEHSQQQHLAPPYSSINQYKHHHPHHPHTTKHQQDPHHQERLTLSHPQLSFDFPPLTTSTPATAKESTGARIGTIELTIAANGSNMQQEGGSDFSLVPHWLEVERLRR